MLRDRLMDRQVIVRDEDGRYRLARDLHDLPLWQLQEWLNDEGELPTNVSETLPAWEKEAISLLAQRRKSTREHLNTPLAVLFATKTAEANAA